MTITSEPRLPTAVVDMGKNLENVEFVERRLLERVPDAAPDARTVDARAAAARAAARRLAQ